VIDLHVITNIFAQPNLQQLINQVQLLTWAVLATQGSNYTFPPSTTSSFTPLQLHATPNTCRQLHYSEKFGHDEMLGGLQSQWSLSLSREHFLCHEAHERHPTRHRGMETSH